jgi:hypothetical protein
MMDVSEVTHGEFGVERELMMVLRREVVLAVSMMSST